MTHGHLGSKYIDNIQWKGSVEEFIGFDLFSHQFFSSLMNIQFQIVRIFFHHSYHVVQKVRRFPAWEMNIEYCLRIL